MSGIAGLCHTFGHSEVAGEGPFGAGLVLAPTTSAEAAAILGEASRQGVIVLPLGGGSHQGIGGRVRPGLVIDTRHLLGVDWHPDNLTVTVGAGVRVADLEEQLAARRQSAVLPENPGTATVGGCVAAAVSGWRRLRYGPIRDRVLEVVLATGDGRLVRGGAQVVKNVSGYGINRLAVGSLGSLGVITRVCFKLWPVPAAATTVTVDDPDAALTRLYRPQAMVEADGVACAYLAGIPGEVEQQASAAGGEVEAGHRWPGPISAEVVVAVRVPPSATREAVGRLEGAPYRAAFGVGEVVAGFTTEDALRLVGLRSWAEGQGGSLVTLFAPGDFYQRFDPWGTAAATLELQRRIKKAFDPVGIMSPGRLAGGL